jgi:hypothetical protein
MARQAPTLVKVLLDPTKDYLHIPEAMEQQPSRVSTIPAAITENEQARRVRRGAAGRSGGVFEIVPNANELRYRYVWPDHKQKLLDRLIDLTEEWLSDTSSANPANKERSSKKARKNGNGKSVEQGKR